MIARRLERPGIPGRDRLVPRVRHALVARALARGDGAVADHLALLGALGDLLQEVHGGGRVAPVHAARVHQDGDRRAGLDRVEPDLVAEPVELGDLVEGLDRAGGTQQRERLELERARLVVAVLVVDDVRALHDAAGHAVVHAAAALVEALHDPRAVERLDVGALALGAVLVDEGVQHVRHRDDRRRAVLEHLRPVQVLLRVGLVQLVEVLARRGARPGLAGIDEHPLEPLGTHHRPDAAARGVARRAALLILVGAGDGRPGELEFTGGPDRDRARVLALALEELLAGRVVPHALVVVGRDDRDFALVDADAVALVRVRGLALHDDRPNPELHQVLARIAAGVRLLDAAGERALAADRDAAGGRRGRPGQDAGRHHEHVVRTERVAGRIAVAIQDLRGETATPEQLPLVREGLVG